MRISIYIVCLLLLSIAGMAQVTNEPTGLPSKRIKVINKVENKTSYVRWAPESADLWLIGAINGYKVLRRQASDLEQLSNMDFEEIATVIPLNKEKWIAEAEKRPDDSQYNIGLQAIHGGWENSYEEGDILGMIDRNDELQNRFAFSILAADFDFETAAVSGLAFKEIIADTFSYLEYNIVPILPENVEFGVSIGVSVINIKYQTEYPNINFRIEQHEGSVSLYWDREYYNEYYSGYWVEVSDDNKNFKRLDNVPYIHAVENDSLLYTPYINYNHKVENYTPMYYRIGGIDPFGKVHTSPMVVKGMGIDKTPPLAPEKVKAKFISETDIEVSWTTKVSKDHNGFIVFKGYEVNGPWYPVSPRIAKGKTSFVDTGVSNILNNYYVVTAIDTSGNDATSLSAYASINDTIPPSIPIGLNAEVDTLGNVTISWNRNKEADILGYKVQFANDPDHEFSILTGEAVTDTFFHNKIALNTTTPAVYYKIFAVDLRYNYSPTTEMIKVERPDTIPPLQPIFRDYYVSKDTIAIMWSASNSKDAEKQSLWRSRNAIDWTLVAELSKDIEQYNDLDLPETGGYYYKLIAYDIHGLTSVSPSHLYLEVVESKTADKIPSLLLKSNENKLPILNWVLDQQEFSKIYLYRSKNGQQFIQYKSFDSSNNTFIDKNILEGNTYSYVIKAKDRKGKETIFSKPVVWDKGIFTK